jgi:hypothetical protein
MKEYVEAWSPWDLDVIDVFKDDVDEKLDYNDFDHRGLRSRV